MALVGPYLGVYYFNFLIARYVRGGKHLGLYLVGKICKISRTEILNIKIFPYQFSDFSNNLVNLTSDLFIS